MNTLPIEQTCFWLARRPPPDPQPKLRGVHNADLVVVGAGFTGLWTALFLRELNPQLDIAIVEQGGAAHGASGRNAGMLAETVDHSHGLASEHFGNEEASRLARIGRENITEMLSFLARYQVDCDYEPTGRMFVALTEAHIRSLNDQVAAAAQLGIFDHQLLSAQQTQEELHSPLYRGGLVVPGGGVLDPVKLVEGLRRVALAQGIRLFEHSPAERLESDGSCVRVVAANGAIRAPRVIVALSAYTHRLLPRVIHRFIPLYDYVTVSEPLTRAQLESIGWRRRQGVTDMRNFFLYYRLTADNRILWGTSEAVYYRGNRVGDECDHSPEHRAHLRASFRQHFPQLSGLEFPYSWGGPICATTRLTPFFGSAFDGRVTYGLGFTGHGLGTTRLAGRILAHLALAQPHEYLALSLVRRPPFPYPPEPLRGLAVSLVTRALRRVDNGEPPNLLLRMLAKFGIGFSS